MITIDYATRMAILAELTSAGKPLDGATLSIGLYLTPRAPGTRYALADLNADQPTFAGYAKKTPVVWGPIYKDGFDNVYRDGGLQEWICTAKPAAPISISGVFWDDGVNVRIDPLPTPVQIRDAQDLVRYLVTIAYGQ